MLLAAFDERRPTADVDLLATAVANDVEAISAVVREVLAIDVDDGVVFEPDGLRALVIRDADPYTGVRVTVPARIDRARHPLRVDIDVGDPVTPEPVEVSYPSLLDEPFDLVGYPLDFADVYILTGTRRRRRAARLRHWATGRGWELLPVRRSRRASCCRWSWVPPIVRHGR